MAIKIIYGRGGSGKSLLQMHIVIQELRETKRNISTNLAINVPALNEYVERTYPEESIDVVGRIRLLTEAETKEFWKYRGPTKWTGNEYDCEIDKGVNGTCFIIDEAGASGFSAQDWAAKTAASIRGVECTWYLDQQRKFNDNVYASTNGSTPSLIAKGFRDKAHEFIRLKNESHMTIGKFRGRNRIVADYFLKEPDSKTEAFKQTVLEVDVQGIASCYWTERGVGIVGSAADKGWRPKGWSVWWLFPIGIGIASLAGIVPFVLGKVASKAVAPSNSLAPTSSPVSSSVQSPQAKASSLVQDKAPSVYGDVSGVFVQDGAVMVSVRGVPGWLRVVAAITPDEYLLEGDVLVKKADILRPRGLPPELKKAGTVASGG